ncbi:hypothetical protein QO009_004032 [Brevibacillus aydinogluensis]|jgi:hypothetical protein|uniref:DUF4309 domain-containing protein n=1 Tax=Brevibacillus aydinogluensis TaxID=927786 RepID=UPI00289317B4|nr:DUF4309 domain-containing protein [Brevibacillus aydinogluensis]MDT3418107.1 hypothetical protein [Brevibacillus aydinogluensis]
MSLRRMYRTLFCVGLLCSMVLIGCSTSSETADGGPVRSEKSDTVKKLDSETVAGHSTNPVTSDVLEKAKNGQLHGVSIGLGATKKEVIEKLGKPARTGNDEFGFAMYYDGFSLGFEDYANSIDELSENSKVIVIFADPKIVNLTGKPFDIKEKLGTPSREVLNDSGDDTFILEYAGNDHLLKVVFDTNPVKYITLQEK